VERYAGIESGRECERLAPALSAFVDGEADAAAAVELRMHLRRCVACRAAVRGLREASRPLAVVFPAVGLAVAGGGAEQTGSFFVRVYEALTVHLHERTANSLLRAQAIVDTVTAGKMAAAAASAAALAGGGVAVEGVLTSAPPATPQAIVRRADNGLGTAGVNAPAKTSAPAKRRSRTRASTPQAEANVTVGLRAIERGTWSFPRNDPDSAGSVSHDARVVVEGFAPASGRALWRFAAGAQHRSDHQPAQSGPA
jgi:hypothetical protein